MGASLGSRRQRQALNLDAKHLPAQEENRAERLILGARGNALVYRQMRRVIAHIFGRDPRVGDALALGAW